MLSDPKTLKLAILQINRSDHKVTPSSDKEISGNKIVTAETYLIIWRDFQNISFWASTYNRTSLGLSTSATVFYAHTLLSHSRTLILSCRIHVVCSDSPVAFTYAHILLSHICSAVQKALYGHTLLSHFLSYILLSHDFFLCNSWTKNS